MDSRIKNEIDHGLKISERAEDIWGWESSIGKIRAQRRADYFIQIAGLKPGDNILEIGCGTGVFTEKISKIKAKITATDISDVLLNEARKKNIPDCKFEIADAHRLHVLVYCIS